MTTNPAPLASRISTFPDRRVAIVTGGSRGIGRAISRRLATDGFAIAVTYAGNTTAAEETLAEIHAAGGTAIALRADEHQMATLFDTVEQNYGGVDVVVNSAGRMALSPIAELDLASLDALHRTNIRGSFVVAQQAARRLRAGGAFVGVSTTVVATQLPTYGTYAASKAAAEGMTLILARELRGRDVTVNTVAPGPPRPICSWTARARSRSRPSPPRPASAPRHSRGRRRNSRLPRRARRALDQRTGAPRERGPHGVRSRRAGAADGRVKSTRG